MPSCYPVIVEEWKGLAGVSPVPRRHSWLHLRAEAGSCRKSRTTSCSCRHNPVAGQGEGGGEREDEVEGKGGMAEQEEGRDEGKEKEDRAVEG